MAETGSCVHSRSKTKRRKTVTMATETTPLLRPPLSSPTRDGVMGNDLSMSPETNTQPVARALAGVVLYVEVRSTNSSENRSSAIEGELEALGATVCTRLTKDVTHVVFKDGKTTVRERAEKSHLYLVSPLWVEACKRANDWISEAKYPVIFHDGGGGGGGESVVLGKIKRIKSMQPKPLEEEIAKSLQRSRKRSRLPPLSPLPSPKVKERVSGNRGRRGGRRRDTDPEPVDPESDHSNKDSDLDLPPITLTHTPRQPLSEKTQNTVTPYLTSAPKTTHHKVRTSQEMEEAVLSPRQPAVTKETRYSLVATPSSVKRRRSRKGKKTVSTKEGNKVVVDRTNSCHGDTKTIPSVTAAKKMETMRKRTNSKPFAKELPSIVFTSVDIEDQDIAFSVVKKLGGFTVSPQVTENTTHVVCGKARRTTNVLAATVKGCWVVCLEWLLKSLEMGRWVEEEPFEMADSFPAAQFFRLERRMAGSLYQPTLFSSAGSIFVSLTSSPPTNQLELLLAFGGGKVTRSLRKCDVCVGCYSPREGDGVKCVTEQWILDSITEHQMLPFEEYFLENIMSNSRATSPEL